jgi:RimJ/RimL family protein N-acetyltransferase
MPLAHIEMPGSLESERLLLSPPASGEELAIWEAVRESFASLSRWLSWARTLPTPEQLEESNLQLQARFRERSEFHFRIRHKTDRRLLGSIGLVYIDPEVPSFELGFWLRDSARHQGYMQEAARLVIDFAIHRLGAARLQLRIDPRNEASCRLAERCGFVREGLCRNLARDNSGQLAAYCLYGLVPAAPPPSPGQAG